ncbi:MAG: DUF5916 domain-containing protein, partial [Ignavibacteriaceae bacterium]
MKIKILFFLFPLILLNVFALDSKVKNDDLKIYTSKLNASIILDGELTENVWSNSLGISNFIQRDPVEGAEPTEKTIVQVIYNDDALYIGARMYDSSPDSIISRLSRKDVDANSDLFGVFLDPYFDKRSGYYFGLNAAGTLYDGVLYNDDWDDESWDAVWEGKVHIDDKGWTAEIKIPFSQLRFQESNSSVWGINFRRDIARKNERDYLVYVPKNESGFVSHFAELHGIENIKSSNKLEILPYITTRAEFTDHSLNDPFNNGSKYIPNIGADLKMGIGSNLTLNATVNPDFGQVEIDPAVINLSDVETFFSEKRPFFVEGSIIFKFGQGGARSYWGFNWANPNFFYSRRIGRTPQGSTPDNDFEDYPTGTHILGAAKLTGKLNGNWNIGVIQSLTQREYAKIDQGGKRFDVEVEPLTYYGVFRAQKEFANGKQGLGFVSTIAARNFNDPKLRDEFNSGSYTLGLDGWTFLDSSKTWVFAGWAGLSQVRGNEEQLISIQENSRHYFQRPDAKSFSVDSSVTSLNGYAARFHLNKQKGNLFVNSAFGVISPKFDINDLGFLWRADVVNMHIGGGYTWNDPTKIYRFLESGIAVFRNYDFDGDITWQGIFNFGTFQFLNYYSIDWDLAYNPETINNRLTRGGPLALNEPGYQVDFSVHSDGKKNFVAGAEYSTYRKKKSYQYQLSTEFQLRPSSNISFSISPFYERNHDHSQWIDSFEDSYASSTFGHRYVFGTLDQNTVGAGIRLNWTFNPQLSLQLYVQPLISSGSYTNFKELAAPKTYNFNIYGEGNSTFDEGNLTADPDGTGPAPAIEIDNPDFNFKSLRGNAVLRWEYLPGSV